MPSSGRAGRRLSCCSKTNPRQKSQNKFPPRHGNWPRARSRAERQGRGSPPPPYQGRGRESKGYKSEQPGLRSAGSWMETPQTPLPKRGQGRPPPGRRVGTRIPSPCCQAPRHGEGQALGHSPPLPAGGLPPPRSPPGVPPGVPGSASWHPGEAEVSNPALGTPHPACSCPKLPIPCRTLLHGDGGGIGDVPKQQGCRAGAHTGTHRAGDVGTAAGAALHHTSPLSPR